MPKFIASYDLSSTSSPHAEFLEQARAQNWALWILSSENIWYRLPNTTLLGEFSTRDAAVAALRSARAATEKSLGRKVTMEKFIVAEYDGASFESDVQQAKK